MPDGPVLRETVAQSLAVSGVLFWLTLAAFFIARFGFGWLDR